MFLAYLKLHKKSIICFALSFVIFFVVLRLFDVPEIAIFYAAALCALMLIIFFAFDYTSFAKKHKALKSALKSITYSLENLPKAESITDEAYQKLINELFEYAASAESHMNAKYYDMKQYYTKWVHQIKTPISAVHLMLDFKDDEESREILQELFRIEQYCDMALSYARISSYSNDYVIKEYELDLIIKQALRKYASVFIRKKIELKYDSVGISVVTDEKQLLFVIEQIISNALKYTNSGSISIYSENGDTLIIRDTGIGIAKEDVPRIFENGYTGLNGRIDKKSSGIGLYLCKCICDKLGHKLYAESEIKKGTAIKLCFKQKKLDIEKFNITKM